MTNSDDDPVEKSDPDLVLAARHGDRSAFVEIVARHQSLVCGMAYGILNDLAASEDVAQETFLKAWMKLADLREPENLRPWLARIARNAALGKRRVQREGASLEEIAELRDDGPLPDQVAATADEATLVRQQLAALPEAYRVPLVLFYREGKSVRAVAEALELSEDVVKKRLARGRSQLRQRMVSLVEVSLADSRPNAVFTMAVAAAVGALTNPSSVAASAFTASANSAAAATATSSTSVILTTMTSLQAPIFAATLVAFLCLPVGYATRKWLEPEPPTQAHLTNPSLLPVETEPRDPFDIWPNSKLLAQWKLMHETHGYGPDAMQAIMKEINGLPDPFRRGSFRAALLAEWAEIDPEGGFAFFSSRQHSWLRGQFVDEWLIRDPDSTITALMAKPDGWDTLALDRLSVIAQESPNRLGEIVSQLPELSESWSEKVTKAFADLAAVDLENARVTAESLGDRHRVQALAGVAKAWAMRDPDRALTWAKAIPEGNERDEVIRGALKGLAHRSPGEALELIGLVPPGGADSHFGSTTAARVLAEAADADFDATTAWLAANPKRLSSLDIDGLTAEISKRLNADPKAFLDARVADGSLRSLVPSISTALMNDSGGQVKAIWEWLGQHSHVPGWRELQRRVVSSTAYSDPDSALTIVASLDESEEFDGLRYEFGSAIFNGGRLLHRFDTIMQKAPASLHASILAGAFRSLNSDAVGDPQVWVDRFDALPSEARAEAARGFSRAWAGSDPAGAAAWALKLPEGQVREDAISSLSWTWTANDAPAASEWIASLPEGSDRDRGAQALATGIASSLPEEAWQWAISISSPERRGEAASTVVARALAGPVGKSADFASWIESAPLAPSQKEQLRKQTSTSAP
ncbi:MAG: sigma-70 family RNA polymerase sigma factor [Verrucomicrobiae bacterium]|nr:sigma-70 family RNA polymerase sigma factor [Verrucomicrobiae bacterium]